MARNDRNRLLYKKWAGWGRGACAVRVASPVRTCVGAPEWHDGFAPRSPRLADGSDENAGPPPPRRLRPPSPEARWAARRLRAATTDWVSHAMLRGVCAWYKHVPGHPRPHLALPDQVSWRAGVSMASRVDT